MLNNTIALHVTPAQLKLLIQSLSYLICNGDDVAEAFEEDENEFHPVQAETLAIAMHSEFSKLL